MTGLSAADDSTPRRRMRLQGEAMVRNEADVIEAFVRHNLTILDGLLVIDHGSIDATAEILSRLQSEGLPLRVEREADPAFRQSEVVTAGARQLLSSGRADFVFALDADEFLKVGSRPILESVLAQVPDGVHAALEWLTYVPDAFADADVAFGQQHLRRRLAKERHGVHKVVATRALLHRPRDVIASGNHCIQDPAAPPDSQLHAIVHRDVVAVAHCPVRSRAQLEGKIAVGYLAHLASRPGDSRLAHHWRDLYVELRGGAVLGEGRLREIAANYGLAREVCRPLSAIALVEDPVALATEQRYGVHARLSALRLLMHFAESLVARTGEASRDAPAAVRSNV
jgi:hypothetical protein